MAATAWTVAVVSAPLIGLAVCVGAHILVSRAARGLARQHGLLVAVAIGGAAVMALLTPELRADLAHRHALDAWGSLGASVLAYLGFAYGYVIGFFNIGESARRIRLVIELYAAGTRGLTLPEVLRAYNARMVLDARIHRLLAGGQIVEREGRYVLRSRLMLLGARALVLLKVVLLRRPTELPLEASVAPGWRKP